MKPRSEADLPVLVGLQDEEDFPHRGIINFSDNKVDTGTGTLRVRGVISNPKPRLLSPGLFVRIRLPLGSPTKSILIDEQAIGSQQSNKFVYVIKTKKEKVKDDRTKEEKEVEIARAYQTPIKVGPLNKGLRAVADGLAETDRVIISGLQRVKNGEKVIPIPMKKKPAESKGEQAAPRAPAEAPKVAGATAQATPPSSQPSATLAK
jgi:multidrug efflux pump subunit AcrA (membrane-fusion protein)